MKNTRRNGSALVLVVVSALFLIILTGALYTYLKSNVDTQVWARDRIQAKLTAEAGITLATHMLVAGAELPSTETPQPILGTETSWETLPGDLGEVYVSVDPSNNNNIVTNSNAFMLRGIAKIPGGTDTFGMEAIVMPENLARFSVFMDKPSLSGYYADGYRFDGPFYANGPICIYSSSSDSLNDPFFYSFHLTSDYYVYGTGGGGTHASTPEVGNLQMQPYNRLSMGEPYFELGADTIPFGADELDWEGVRNAASTGGLYLTDVPDGARLVLRDSTLVIKREEYGAIATYDLASMANPVVWIENGDNERVYLSGKASKPFSMALTLGMKGHLYIGGNLFYENTDLEDLSNDNLLGVMTVQGDLVIANDPLIWEAGWGDGFQIITDDEIHFHAVLVALEGRLLAEDYHWPQPGEEFRLVGGYMIQEEWYTGTSSSGFDIGVYFDPRLLSRHPPFFPTTANWLNIMWQDRPDMEEDFVTQGIPEY